MVALLPLSQAVDAQQLWNLILGAFLPPVLPAKHGKGEAMEEDITPGAACCLLYRIAGACYWAVMSQGRCWAWQSGIQDTQELACSLIRFPHRTSAGAHPMVPTLVAVPGKSRQRFVLLPPPADRTDPLSIVDLGKAAEVMHC